MDARRALPFFLLILSIGAASSFKNGRGPNSPRQPRRTTLSEFLVPPPPPRPNFVRTGRLANPQPTDSPGYFSKLMSWLNPFGFGAAPSPPPIPGPPPDASLKYLPPPPIYSGPPPPVDAPPFPPLPSNQPSATTLNNQYLPPHKEKNCNPCNKVPWTPMQGDSEGSLIPPLPPTGGGYLPPPGTGYLPPIQDVHQAASQEIRTPDFSHAINQNGRPPVGPLPNPHLYPGPMPPLFKAAPFQVGNIGGNSGLLPPPPPVNSSFGNIEQDLHVQPAEQVFLNHGAVNDHGGNQYREEDLTFRNQNYQSGDSNPNGHAQVHSTDSARVPAGSAFGDDILGHQTGQDLNGPLHGFGASGSSQYPNLDFLNPGNLGNLNSGSNLDHNQQYSGNFRVSSQGFQDLSSTSQQFQSFPNHGNFETNQGFSSLDQSHLINGNYQTQGLHDPSGVNQGTLNTPTSFGASGSNNQLLDQRYNDLSSSSSNSQDTHALNTATEGSSDLKNSIHFEQSPLLDLTQKGESRTDSPPSTSNVFVDTDGSDHTITTSGFPTIDLEDQGSGIKPTESYASLDTQSPDNLLTYSEKDTSKSDQRDNRQNFKDPRNQDLFYIPPSAQPGFLWSSITTLKPVRTYDSQESDELQDASIAVPKQGTKKNKQVQVIIPYTSQYTPVPFHQSSANRDLKSNLERSQPRKVPYLTETGEKFVGQESRSDPKVASIAYSQKNTSTTIAANDSKTNRKTNNSIDVHRLQKNIDNWTIQEYSSGTTSSTVLPSSLRPYLLPSKKIPDEYFTTTESSDHVDGDRDENVKTYALAGFSFNDLEQEGSASNRVEGHRVQFIARTEDENRTGRNNNTNETKQNTTWEEFPVTVSPSDKKRVYVVTPQPVYTTSKENLEEKRGKESAKTRKPSESDLKKTKTKQSSFESIEKAYQVLPQAVNNLAVASTGPESVPLWGIMEHEEFASLNNEENDNNDDSAEGPILYTGHSKVSRARR